MPQIYDEAKNNLIELGEQINSSEAMNMTGYNKINTVDRRFGLQLPTIRMGNN